MSYRTLQDKEKSISSFKGELETKCQPYGSMGGARDRPLPLPPSADPKSKPPPPSQPRPPASPPEEDDDDEEFDEPIQSRPENKKKPIGKAYANANFSPSVTDPSDAISFKVQTTEIKGNDFYSFFLRFSRVTFLMLSRR